MRKFDLKRGSDGHVLAWSVDIAAAKELLDKLYEESYILTFPGKNVVEYSFPEWYRTNNQAWDESWGQSIKYANLVLHENQYYTPIS